MLLDDFNKVLKKLNEESNSMVGYIIQDDKIQFVKEKGKEIEEGIVPAIPHNMEVLDRRIIRAIQEKYDLSLESLKVTEKLFDRLVFTSCFLNIAFMDTSFLLFFFELILIALGRYLVTLARTYHAYYKDRKYIIDHIDEINASLTLEDIETLTEEEREVYAQFGKIVPANINAFVSTKVLLKKKKQNPWKRKS